MHLLALSWLYANRTVDARQHLEASLANTGQILRRLGQHIYTLGPRRQERVRDALRSLAEHAAAERLIAAGLLEDDHGVLRPTPRAEATFRAPPDRSDLR